MQAILRWIAKLLDGGPYTVIDADGVSRTFDAFQEARTFAGYQAIYHRPMKVMQTDRKTIKLVKG